MVSTQLFVIGLAVLFFPESFSKPVSRANVREERSDDAQPLEATVENMATKLLTLVSSVTAMENQISVLNARRCETGTVSFHPHDQPTVSNLRTHTVHISFTHSFATTPWVSIGINRLDSTYTANVRIDVGVEGVSTSGFNAHAFEWANTYTVTARASWVACNV